MYINEGLEDSIWTYRGIQKEGSNKPSEVTGLKPKSKLWTEIGKLSLIAPQYPAPATAQEHRS